MRVCLNSLNKTQQLTVDAFVKTDLYQLKNLASNYDATNSTYKGYDSQSDAQTLINNIKQNGSAVIQNATNKTFMAYAYLPYDKKFFCVDSVNTTDNSGEFDQILPTQTSCK